MCVRPRARRAWARGRCPQLMPPVLPPARLPADRGLGLPRRVCVRSREQKEVCKPVIPPGQRDMGQSPRAWVTQAAPRVSSSTLTACPPIPNSTWGEPQESGCGSGLLFNPGLHRWPTAGTAWDCPQGLGRVLALSLQICRRR